MNAHKPPCSKECFTWVFMLFFFWQNHFRSQTVYSLCFQKNILACWGHFVVLNYNSFVFFTLLNWRKKCLLYILSLSYSALSKHSPQLFKFTCLTLPWFPKTPLLLTQSRSNTHIRADLLNFVTSSHHSCNNQAWLNRTYRIHDCGLSEVWNPRLPLLSGFAFLVPNKSCAVKVLYQWDGFNFKVCVCPGD